MRDLDFEARVSRMIDITSIHKKSVLLSACEVIAQLEDQGEERVVLMIDVPGTSATCIRSLLLTLLEEFESE